MKQAFRRAARCVTLQAMASSLNTRHPEAFADERQAPWVAALWAAMLLMAVLAALFG